MRKTSDPVIAQAPLTDAQREYIAEVKRGREVTFDDMADWKNLYAIRFAVETGIIDPDDQRLVMPEERREWLRVRAGKPTQ